MHRAFNLYPRKCRECGKAFEAGTDYAFKEERSHGRFNYLCSWHCLQQFRQKKGEKHENTDCRAVL